jgi:hypothetical protein
VHYLELHPEKNALIAATHGRGIIIIDDITPLRKIDASLINTNLTFFDTKPFTISEKSNFGGTALSNQFVGDNPSSDALISYFLPKRHTFGKMTAEIADTDGNLVSKLEAGKLKGINTISWSFNGLAPKVAKGKGLSFAGAPTVKAGTYKLRINKGNEVFEKEISVQYDPNSTFTLAERTAQQQVTMELFDMIQDLAYFVYQIDLWDATVDAYQQKNSAPNKTVSKLGQELDVLRNKLVVTTGDNYVGAADPQLKEKLNDIYGTIASYYGAPSSTQLENIATLKKALADAKAEYEKLKTGSIKSFEKELMKNKTVEAPIVVPFEEFLKLD